MAGETLDIDEILDPDNLAHHLISKYMTWDTARQNKVEEWKELRKYVYATDTRTTANQTLPWKNSTTLPKLCQIADNLLANYEAALFPRRKWLEWEGDDANSDKKEKKEAIITYMNWVTSRPQFKKQIKKLLYDYVHYGNVFAYADWRDESSLTPVGTKTGYIGPVIVRVNPLDHTFNPTASSYEDSPKFVRTFLSIGELQKRIRMAAPDQQETMQKVFDYVMNVRGTVINNAGNMNTMNEFYKVDGFDSFSIYLSSDYVEVLTFYGDYYDVQSKELKENRIVTLVDRHKILSDVENPSNHGNPSLRHAGWRIRQDNLWAMGPLDNLVGLQYRLDHVENMKSDVLDLTVAPLLKVKGDVIDFDWAPMERIYVGDEGDVSTVGPDTQVLQANIELSSIENRMEEMAGAPREAAGFRTPGEKTAFEVQRLENAASRIFQNKVMQFEEIFLEPLLNDMLEVARRNMTASSIRIFNDELKFSKFVELTSEDITGVGRIIPVAARNFAEKANITQNLNEFYNSAAGSDPEVRQHFGSFRLARMFEQLMDIEDFDVVQENIRIGERADAQRQSQSLSEQVEVEQGTPSGLTPGDVDEGLDDDLLQEFFGEEGAQPQI